MEEKMVLDLDLNNLPSLVDNVRPIDLSLTLVLLRTPNRYKYK
ncbi:unnamed protein product [Camellia sinensis]